MSQQRKTTTRTAASAAVELVTSSAEETQAFGERLGRALRAGDVVALSGELGSGKTTLIQGIAKGLGRDPEAIRSPTFVLMREYPPAPAAEEAGRLGAGEGPTKGLGGEVPLVHIDAYRLSGAPAAAWLDLELMLSPEKVTLIEWAERMAGLLPEAHLQIRMSHVSTNRRRIELSGSGARHAALISQMKPEPSTPPIEVSNEPARD